MSESPIQSVEDLDGEPEVLEFSTINDVRSNKNILFRIEGDDRVYAAHRPKDAQLALVAAGLDGNPAGSAVESIRIWLGAEDWTHLRARLSDPDDSLELGDLVPVIQGLVANMVGKDGKSPAGSSRQQHSSGKKSTGKRR